MDSLTPSGSLCDNSVLRYIFMEVNSDLLFPSVFSKGCKRLSHDHYMIALKHTLLYNALGVDSETWSYWYQTKIYDQIVQELQAGTGFDTTKWNITEPPNEKSLIIPSIEDNNPELTFFNNIKAGGYKNTVLDTEGGWNFVITPYEDLNPQTIYIFWCKLVYNLNTLIQIYCKMDDNNCTEQVNSNCSNEVTGWNWQQNDVHEEGSGAGIIPGCS